MNIIYFSHKNASPNNERVNFLLDTYINKIANKQVEFNLDKRKIIKSTLFNGSYLKLIFFVFRLFISLPSSILLEIYLIFVSNKRYYKITKDSIIDALERRTGELTTSKNKKKYIIKNLYKFLIYAFQISFFLCSIKLLVKVYRINGIFIPQLDGVPFATITALCIQKGIFVGSYSLTSNNLSIILRKGKDNQKLNERYPIPYDLKKLSEINDIELDQIIDKIKFEYISRSDQICNPNLIKKNIDNSRIISKFKNSKKRNVVVLLHVFTDQARFRMDKFWFNSYFDWFLKTIELCKLNKNVNWIFKGHPYENKYPIKKKYSDLIKNIIKNNNFFYVESKEQFLHDDIAKLNCVVLTCHGTCKIEYPAMFGIPVISCIGSYLNYDSYEQPLTAKNLDEYKNLILNAHNVCLTKIDIRESKELLAFFKYYSGLDINQDLSIKKYLDSNEELVYRNY